MFTYTNEPGKPLYGLSIHIIEEEDNKFIAYLDNKLKFSRLFSVTAAVSETNARP